MARSKLAPPTDGPAPSAASLDDYRAAIFELTAAMFAVLSSAFAEVRLFERTPGRDTRRFEDPLPHPRDLLRALERFTDAERPQEWGMLLEAAADLSAASNAAAHSATESHPFLRVIEWLRHSDHEDPTFDAIRGLRAQLEAPSTQGSLPNALDDEPALTRRAILDLIVDTRSQSFRVELSATREDGPDTARLRGEDLDELRHNAALLPPPEASVPADLPSDAYLTAAAAADRLHVSKSTVTRRIAQNRLIGFRAFTRTLRIPEDQFDGDDVVPGIPDVLALFARSPDQLADHRRAWTFLNSNLFRGDPDPRPIDRLRSAAATGATPDLLSELARAKESLDRGDHF